MRICEAGRKAFRAREAEQANTEKRASRLFVGSTLGETVNKNQ